MGLGKNIDLHMECLYIGHEKECPKDCSKCAFSFKREGDNYLTVNRINDAIKQYKKALFSQPRYAEAWCNLGNAFCMISEYNNALSAYNKALGIDPQYGDAMFGKAVALRSLGKKDDAMKTANEILEIYDDISVHRFKSELKKEGVRDTAGVYSVEKAIDSMTEKAYQVISANNLYDKDGTIHSIKEIDRKIEFANSIFTYCKRKYGSLGQEMVWSESIIAAYYGSAFVAFKYYQMPSAFSDIEPFDYLNDNIDLEKIDRETERIMGIVGKNDQCEKIWSIVYSFMSFCVSVIKKVEPVTDIDKAAIDATESAYVIGMLIAMRHKEQENIKKTRTSLDYALSRLAESTKDYNYNPPRMSAMCYSINVPDKVSLYFTCDGCGREASIDVYDAGGKEKDIITNYLSLSEEFTDLGYPSTVKCYCDQCAEKYYPSQYRFNTNNIVFSVRRPDSDTPINSFPNTSSYQDFEYRIALEFLKGADTFSKLSKATGTELSAETYLKHVYTVLGNVKTEMDENR